MKYWLYTEGDISGPYEAGELVNVPGFRRISLLCPADSPGENPGDWQKADTFGEVADMLSAASSSVAVAEPPASEPASDFIVERQDDILPHEEEERSSRPRTLPEAELEDPAPEASWEDQSVLDLETSKKLLSERINISRSKSASVHEVVSELELKLRQAEAKINEQLGLLEKAKNHDPWSRVAQGYPFPYVFPSQCGIKGPTCPLGRDAGPVPQSAPDTSRIPPADTGRKPNGLGKIEPEWMQDYEINERIQAASDSPALLPDEEDEEFSELEDRYSSAPSLVEEDVPPASIHVEAPSPEKTTRRLESSGSLDRTIKQRVIVETSPAREQPRRQETETHIVREEKPEPAPKKGEYTAPAPAVEQQPLPEIKPVLREPPVQETQARQPAPVQQPEPQQAQQPAAVELPPLQKAPELSPEVKLDPVPSKQEDLTIPLVAKTRQQLPTLDEVKPQQQSQPQPQSQPQQPQGQTFPGQIGSFVRPAVTAQSFSQPAPQQQPVPVSKPTQAYAQPEPVPAAYSTPMPIHGHSQKDDRRRKSGVKFMLLVIGAVMLVVVGAAMLLLSSDDSSSKHKSKKKAVVVDETAASSEEQQTSSKSGHQQSAAMPSMPASSGSPVSSAQEAKNAASAASQQSVMPPQQAEALTGATVADGVKKAIDIVKGYNLGRGRGTIEQWLQNSYMSSSAGGQEDWSATMLNGNAYVVQYRLLRPRVDPIVYQFQTNIATGEITRGINNSAIELLGSITSGGSASPEKTTRSSVTASHAGEGETAAPRPSKKQRQPARPRVTKKRITRTGSSAAQAEPEQEEPAQEQPSDGKLPQLPLPAEG